MLEIFKTELNRSIFLFLNFIPYLINIESIKWTPKNILIVIISILLLEIGYRKLSVTIYKKAKFDINFIAIPSILIITYFPQFVFYGNKLNTLIFNCEFLRIRYIVAIMWIVTIILFCFVSKKGHLVINTFMIIFCVNSLISNAIPTKKKELLNHFTKINSSYSKPVILIILDEYASPIELYKNKVDSSIFNFSKKLISAGWKLNNEQYSYNLTTVHSISSLFNYNFKLNDSNLKVNQSIQKLRESTLFQDLNKKSISFHNFGIFDIGSSKALSKIYYYDLDEIWESNFIRQLFAKSMIGLLFKREILINQNKLLAENSFKLVKSISEKKTFIYIHILMPHGPFKYEGYKKYKHKNLKNMEKYIAYWKFTNLVIMEKLLKPLIKSDQFKIILTGDHGFRGESNKVNPHKTITAFYGFDNINLDQIKSVQDLGSIIISSY